MFPQFLYTGPQLSKISFLHKLTDFCELIVRHIRYRSIGVRPYRPQPYRPQQDDIGHRKKPYRPHKKINIGQNHIGHKYIGHKIYDEFIWRHRDDTSRFRVGHILSNVLVCGLLITRRIKSYWKKCSIDLRE